MEKTGVRNWNKREIETDKLESQREIGEREKACIS